MTVRLRFRTSRVDDIKYGIGEVARGMLTNS
jgi:hypothetical protein